MKKKWYYSKTLYVNLIAIVATVLLNVGLEEVSQEIATAEVSILGVINLILRLVTKQGLET